MDYLKSPLDFTRPELPELRDIFAAAYEEKARAKILARNAGIVPGTFPDHDNMRTTWWYLLDHHGPTGEAGADDRACSGRTQKPRDFKPRFEDFLTGRPSLSTLPPRADDAWYKGADRGNPAAQQEAPPRAPDPEPQPVDGHPYRRAGGRSSAQRGLPRPGVPGRHARPTARASSSRPICCSPIITTSPMRNMARSRRSPPTLTASKGSPGHPSSSRPAQTSSERMPHTTGPS